MLRLNVNMKSTPDLTIGELASHFNLPTHALRHWESEGLLSPTRTTGARRRYTPDDLYRVASILKAKQAGLSLPSIREMLTTKDPATRKQVLARHHKTLLAKQAELKTAITLLEGALSCTHQDLITCPNYRNHLEELIQEKSNS